MKKKFAKRLCSLACAALMTVPLWGDISFGIDASAESEAVYEEIVPEVQRDEELEHFTEPEYTPMFSFPDEVRGVYLNPAKDFPLTDENGTVVMLRIDKPYIDSPEYPSFYFLNFQFDAQGNFINIHLQNDIFGEHQLDIAESVVSLDQELVGEAIEEEYRNVDR